MHDIKKSSRAIESGFQHLSMCPINISIEIQIKNCKMNGTSDRSANQAYVKNWTFNVCEKLDFFVYVKHSLTFSMPFFCQRLITLTAKPYRSQLLNWRGNNAESYQAKAGLSIFWECSLMCNKTIKVTMPDIQLSIEPLWCFNNFFSVGHEVSALNKLIGHCFLQTIQMNSLLLMIRESLLINILCKPNYFLLITCLHKTFGGVSKKTKQSIRLPCNPLNSRHFFWQYTFCYLFQRL